MLVFLIYIMMPFVGNDISPNEHPRNAATKDLLRNSTRPSSGYINSKIPNHLAPSSTGNTLKSQTHKTIQHEYKASSYGSCCDSHDGHRPTLADAKCTAEKPRRNGTKHADKLHNVNANRRCRSERNITICNDEYTQAIGRCKRKTASGRSVSSSIVDCDNCVRYSEMDDCAKEARHSIRLDCEKHDRHSEMDDCAKQAKHNKREDCEKHIRHSILDDCTKHARHNKPDIATGKYIANTKSADSVDICPDKDTDWQRIWLHIKPFGRRMPHALTDGSRYASDNQTNDDSCIPDKYVDKMMCAHCWSDDRLSSTNRAQVGASGSGNDLSKRRGSLQHSQRMHSGLRSGKGRNTNQNNNRVNRKQTSGNDERYRKDDIIKSKTITLLESSDTVGCCSDTIYDFRLVWLRIKPFGRHMTLGSKRCWFVTGVPRRTGYLKHSPETSTKKNGNANQNRMDWKPKRGGTGSTMLLGKIRKPRSPLQHGSQRGCVAIHATRYAQLGISAARYGHDRVDHVRLFWSKISSLRSIVAMHLPEDILLPWKITRACMIISDSNQVADSKRHIDQMYRSLYHSDRQYHNLTNENITIENRSCNNTNNNNSRRRSDETDTDSECLMTSYAGYDSIGPSAAMHQRSLANHRQRVKHNDQVHWPSRDHYSKYCVDRYYHARASTDDDYGFSSRGNAKEATPFINTRYNDDIYTGDEDARHYNAKRINMGERRFAGRFVRAMFTALIPLVGVRQQ